MVAQVMAAAQGERDAINDLIRRNNLVEGYRRELEEDRRLSGGAAREVYERCLTAIMDRGDEFEFNQIRVNVNQALSLRGSLPDALVDNILAPSTFRDGARLEAAAAIGGYLTQTKKHLPYRWQLESVLNEWRQITRPGAPGRLVAPEAFDPSFVRDIGHRYGSPMNLPDDNSRLGRRAREQAGRAVDLVAQCKMLVDSVGGGAAEVQARLQDIEGQLRERVNRLTAAVHWTAPTGVKTAPLLARVTDSGWWLRKIRQEHRRARARAANRLGLVGKRSTFKYSTDEACRDLLDSDERNREILAKKFLKNPQGHVYSVLELADKSPHAPIRANAERLAQTAGLERYEIARGRVPLWAVLTAPSGFHPTRAGGREINKKWLEAGEPDALACAGWFRERWTLFNAALADAGIEKSGFRYVETHDDGTLHENVLAFVRREDVQKFRELLNRYFLYERGPGGQLIDEQLEPGALAHRIKFKRLKGKAGAVKYAAKYFQKFLAEEQSRQAAREAGEKMDETIGLGTRLRTQLRNFGIRQFSWFGVESTTIWRSLGSERVEFYVERANLPRDVVAVIAAVRKRDYAAYLETMRAARAAGIEIKILYEQREGLTRYLERPQKTPSGVLIEIEGQEPIEMRLRTDWEECDEEGREIPTDKNEMPVIIRQLLESIRTRGGVLGSMCVSLESRPARNDDELAALAGAHDEAAPNAVPLTVPQLE